jgi:HlyD family secretion protein
MKVGKKLLIPVLGAVVLGGTLYAWSFRGNTTLLVSGTIEARNIRVGSKVGGRILEVKVREGDLVDPGQVLVTFDDRELRAAMEQSEANLEKLEHGSRPEEIAQARAAAAQAEADYTLKKTGNRREDIEAARADLARVKADAVRADLDFQRAKKLADEGIFSRQQLDEAEAVWKISAAQVANFQQKLDAMEHGFRPEEIASALGNYRKAEANKLQTERGFRAEDIALARAQAAFDEARYRERQVESPARATVEVLDVRPGDLIAPNTPIGTLLERDQLYIRVYVPETEIGLVHEGQKAEIRVNSFPSAVFEGVIEQINQKAEFLPRNVQTREERVHQMFGVKVRVNDPSERLRAGMAADLKLKLAEK